MGAARVVATARVGVCVGVGSGRGVAVGCGAHAASSTRAGKPRIARRNRLETAPPVTGDEPTQIRDLARVLAAVAYGADQ